MKCPYCNKETTKVIDSRPADDNMSIRRRRQCDECGRRFTTYEKVEKIPLIVIKKDNNREPYDRSKIEAGIIPVSYTHLPIPSIFSPAILHSFRIVSTKTFNSSIYFFVFS